MHSRSRFALIASLAIATPAAAQVSLASRVAQAPDGIVRMEFDSRPGVCSRGGEGISFRQGASDSPGWNRDPCIAGPVRVALEVRGGDVARVHAQVGGRWPATPSRITDLGIITPHDASAYLFSLVPRLDAQSERDGALLPAVLADADAIPPLIALSRSGTVRVRRSADFWLGQMDDPRGLRRLRDVIGDAANDMGVRENAIFSLSQSNDESSFDALMALARNDTDSRLRGKALFWLAQKHDERVAKLIAELVLK